MDRRVVVTGMGCVTPLGAQLDQLWSRLAGGQSGVGRLSLFDPERLPVQIAAEVRDWDMSDVGEHPRQWQDHPRQTHFAVASAIKAVADAGLETNLLDPARLGVYLGCGETYEDFFRFAQAVSGALRGQQYRPQEFAAGALRVWRPDEEQALELNMPAALIAARFGAEGPNANCIAACSSSTQAIGEATEMIRRGDADVMLAGGAHSMIHPFGMTGFYRLSALSTRGGPPESAVRPFDRERDGFVVGEGGAILVLEDLDGALRRGARIWGEVAGYGSAQDAYRVTDSHPEGRGAAACMNRALDDARLSADEIDYINAHGTGTVVNDKVETTAIKRVFGPAAPRTPISSTKSMLGHFTTAGGAVEAVISLLAIAHRAAPPTINYNTPDPECDLDYVPNTARQLTMRRVLSNSFGFGGQNAALVLSRFDDPRPLATRRAA